MANSGWNGSTLTFGGGGVTPLVDLHQPNDPAEFDTTGSIDTTHTHGTGLNKNSFTASLLGSKCPVAGTCMAITSAIGPSGNQTTKTYDQAIITQMSVSGRKNSRIEGSLTAMPGDTSLTATTQTWTPGDDLGFNGSTFSFSGTAFTGLVGANYTSSISPVESVGGEGGVGGAPPSDELYTPSIPEETLIITCLGGPQCQAKAIGATAMGWNDGGTLGSTVGGYTAECMTTHPGGSLDGQVTTEHTFKVRKTGKGNS